MIRTRHEPRRRPRPTLAQGLTVSFAALTAAALVASQAVPSGFGAALWLIGGGSLVAAVFSALTARRASPDARRDPAHSPSTRRR
jgi:hypothetical protein